MACPREGGEECEHSARGVYRCAEDGGGAASLIGRPELVEGLLQIRNGYPPLFSQVTRYQAS